MTASCQVQPSPTSVKSAASGSCEQRQSSCVDSIVREYEVRFARTWVSGCFGVYNRKVHDTRWVNAAMASIFWVIRERGAVLVVVRRDPKVQSEWADIPWQGERAPRDGP